MNLLRGRTPFDYFDSFTELKNQEITSTNVKRNAGHPYRMHIQIIFLLCRGEVK